MVVLSVKERVAVAERIVAIDPAFAAVINAVGPPPARRVTPPTDRFATLVDSVVSQLLSVKAADSIAARVTAACGGAITVETVRSLSHDELRATGVSNAKARTIHDVADHVANGALELDRHGHMADDDVARELVAVRGIGEWTAHMYLMFTLGRPDVWPVGDLGVRDGWSLLHDLDPMITARDLHAHGNAFAGIRSSAAWYCWQIRHL